MKTHMTGGCRRLGCQSKHGLNSSDGTGSTGWDTDDDGYSETSVYDDVLHVEREPSQACRQQVREFHRRLLPKSNLDSMTCLTSNYSIHQGVGGCRNHIFHGYMWPKISPGKTGWQSQKLRLRSKSNGAGYLPKIPGECPKLDRM